jgi:hypothetical protein
MSNAGEDALEFGVVRGLLAGIVGIPEEMEWLLIWNLKR